MARLTLADAERLAARNRPWTFRLEFTGSNPANQSGVSDKFWYATGRGLHEQIEVGWGASGAKPQLILLDWTTLRTKVGEKIARGYSYADTPFVRMSPGNLARLTGTVTPPASPVTPAPSVAPVPQPMPPAAGPVFMNPAIGTLSAPLNLVTHVRPRKDGDFDGLDGNGQVVLTLPPAGAMELVQDYGVAVSWT